jgi:hypothetical protein
VKLLADCGCPNADEWQYYIAGSRRMAVFAAGENVRTKDFHAGDVGYIPRSFGHSIENTSNSDLVFLEVFNSSYYSSVSILAVALASACGIGTRRNLISRMRRSPHCRGRSKRSLAEHFKPAVALERGIRAGHCNSVTSAATPGLLSALMVAAAAAALLC